MDTQTSCMHGVPGVNAVLDTTWLLPLLLVLLLVATLALLCAEGFLAAKACWRQNQRQQGKQASDPQIDQGRVQWAELTAFSHGYAALLPAVHQASNRPAGALLSACLTMTDQHSKQHQCTCKCATIGHHVCSCNQHCFGCIKPTASSQSYPGQFYLELPPSTRQATTAHRMDGKSIATRLEMLNITLGAPVCRDATALLLSTLVGTLALKHTAAASCCQTVTNCCPYCINASLPVFYSQCCWCSCSMACQADC